MRNLRSICVLMVSLALPAAVHADIVDVVNALRGRSCGNSTLAALKSSAKLNKAANAFARGSSPHHAAVGAGYQPATLASIRFTGFATDAEYRDILSKKYCSTLGDKDLRDIGVARRGAQTWILLGAERKAPDNAAAAGREVLRLVNEARARPRRCGNQKFAAAPPLTLNDTLTKAALSHAREMAKYSFMEHEGRNGSTPAERAARAGYQWASVGENIAAGVETAQEAVAGWLASPGHCANIMSPKYTEMGVAFATNKKDNYGIYWAQSFARPR